MAHTSFKAKTDSDAPAMSRSVSPEAPAVLNVPLTQSRFQKRPTRHGAITVTESDTSDTPMTPVALLRKRSVETLTVPHGDASYTEPIKYHTFAHYRHGAHAYCTSAVGYSSEGDLVLVKDTVSAAVEGDMRLQTKKVQVSQAVCLNPRSSVPSTKTYQARDSGSEEATPGPRGTDPSEGTPGSPVATAPVSCLRSPAKKKYPGVRVPKGRRRRNRLKNDHLSPSSDAVTSDSDDTPELAFEGDAVREGLFEYPTNGVSYESKSLFSKIVAINLDAQDELLTSLRTPHRPKMNAVGNKGNKCSPNSAASRFKKLTPRLKDELMRALNSEPLSDLITQLDDKFASLLSDPSQGTSTVIELEHGYARLVCHGVAAYYNLTSKSEGDGSKRATRVSVPSKGLPPLPGKPLMEYLSARAQRCGNEELVEA